MQSNLDANFLEEIVTSHKLFWRSPGRLMVQKKPMSNRVKTF